MSKTQITLMGMPSWTSVGFSPASAPPYRAGRCAAHPCSGWWSPSCRQAQGKAFVQPWAPPVQGLVPRPRVGAHRQRGLIAGAARARRRGARGQGKCNASPPPPGTFAGRVSGVGHSGMHCPMVSECVQPRAYVFVKEGRHSVTGKSRRCPPAIRDRNRLGTPCREIWDDAGLFSPVHCCSPPAA